VHPNLCACILTGWPRCIGCLIFNGRFQQKCHQFIFRKRTLQLVAFRLLHRMTCNLRHPKHPSVFATLQCASLHSHLVMRRGKSYQACTPTHAPARICLSRRYNYVSAPLCARSSLLQYGCRREYFHFINRAGVRVLTRPTMTAQEIQVLEQWYKFLSIWRENLIHVQVFWAYSRGNTVTR